MYLYIHIYIYIFCYYVLVLSLDTIQHLRDQLVFHQRSKAQSPPIIADGFEAACLDTEVILAELLTLEPPEMVSPWSSWSSMWSCEHSSWNIFET